MNIFIFKKQKFRERKSLKKKSKGSPAKAAVKSFVEMFAMNW